MTTIGFVGPGIMGAPMIANLVSAGHSVQAYGRSERSRQRIAAAGAVAVESLAAAAAGAEIVITMLPDTPDVESVLFGDDGMAQALGAGHVFVDMSTIRPDAARAIAERLRATGTGALDAPVSGGEAAAVEGTLSVMVGGEAEVLDRARSVLEAVSGSITHVGPAGTGQITKAANQLIVAANIQAVSEAILLLESTGADVDKALTAIAGGLAGSTVLQRKRDAFLSSSFTPGFRIALHNKDLRIVRDTADSADVSLPLTAAVSQMMIAASAQGLSELDHSALLQATRALNGTIDEHVTL